MLCRFPAIAVQNILPRAESSQRNPNIKSVNFIAHGRRASNKHHIFALSYMCSHAILLDRRLEVRVCPRALDDLLDRLLHYIPVRSVNAGHLDLKVVLDLHEHLPAFFVIDEADGDADASEATSTTDTM